MAIKIKSYPMEMKNTAEDQYAVDDLTSLVAKIKHLMANKDPGPLVEFLEEDFKLKLLEVEERGMVKFEVRSNLERFLLEENQLQMILRSEAYSNGMKGILLSCFHNLDLAPNEAVDFSDLDLRQASFAGAKLGKSIFNFARTDNTNFYGANLSNCLMTQDQLDKSRSYENARVPSHLSVYWDANIRQSLIQYLEKIEKYVNENILLTDPKYYELDVLHNKYMHILNDTKNPPIAIKKQMLEDFKAAKTVFSAHRNCRYMFAEFLAFLGMLVVGYIGYGLYNYTKTGRFGVFTQPSTEAKMDKLLQYMENTDSGLYEMK